MATSLWGIPEIELGLEASEELSVISFDNERILRNDVWWNVIIYSLSRKMVKMSKAINDEPTWNGNQKFVEKIWSVSRQKTKTLLSLHPSINGKRKSGRLGKDKRQVE